MSKYITGYSKEYWINKGFTEEESIIKTKEFSFNKRKNKKICFEYWESRYNKDQALILYKEFQSNQSKKVKEKNSPLQISTWMKKGFTEEEAKLKISDLQSNRSKKVKNRKNGRTLKELLDKSSNEEEAKHIQYELQNTRSLDSYIKRYGYELGLENFNKSNSKWQKTLNSKYSKQQKAKWSSFTYNDYVQKYGEEKAKLWVKSKNNFKGVSYSKISTELFDIIQSYNTEYTYLYKENEKGIKGDNFLFYVDFYDPKTKKIVEFYGDFWHANPKIYNDDEIYNHFIKKTSKEIIERDNKRITNLLNHKEVSDILIIWESEYLSNKEQIIIKILNYLNNE